VAVFIRRLLGKCGRIHSNVIGKTWPYSFECYWKSVAVFSLILLGNFGCIYFAVLGLVWPHVSVFSIMFLGNCSRVQCKVVRKV
jgi:hypothetical protein